MTATPADVVYIALFYVFSCEDLTRPVFNIPLFGTMLTFKHYKYRQLFLTYVIYFLYHYMVVNNIPSSWTLTGTHLRLSYHFCPTDQIERLLDSFRHKDKLYFTRYLCLFIYFRDKQPFYHLPKKHVNHMLKIHAFATYTFNHYKYYDDIYHIIPVNDATYAFKLDIHKFISNTIILNAFNAEQDPIYDPDVKALYNECLKQLEHHYRNPDTNDAFL